MTVNFFFKNGNQQIINGNYQNYEVNEFTLGSPGQPGMDLFHRIVKSDR